MNLENPSCAASLIASGGDLRASEARIAQAVARAAEREPQLKAFSFRPDRYPPIDDDTAAKPLAGLPIGVKDMITTADMPTTYGSPI
jgi:Asp-tRNA(Asn)/Glu-tRNA(Gln) amidotransferase A subunit family amidase